MVTTSAESDAALTILHERVRLLYRQAFPGLLANLFNSTLVVVVLWRVQPAAWLLAWWTALALVTLARGYGWLAFRRDAAAREHTRRWLWRFALGAYAVGTCWGVAGTFLIPVDHSGHQMFLITVLAGMSAGGVALLGSIWIVYAGFAALMLLPTVAWLLLQGDRIHNYIGLMVFVYTVVVSISAARISRNIHASLALRFERSQLVERLSQSKRDLEQANQQLQQEAQGRKRAQLELQESNRFLERIMDSASEAIFVLDRDGRITRCNHATEVLAKRKPGELQGTAFASLLADNRQPQLEATIQRVAAQGELCSCDDLELRAADGTLISVSVSVSLAPIVDGDAITAMVGVARDMTRRREVERMKEDFISTVSHELRTPLTSIRGALGLIDRSASSGLDDQARSLLAIADSNSERLLRLIDDLLDLQRLSVTAMGFVYTRQPFKPLVEHAVEINRAFAQQYDVSLRLGPLPEARVVRVDRDRFIQVVTNLVSNAVKFSPSGAEVRIFAEDTGSGVRLSVADHGPGIASEFRERIFQRFSQADSSDARRRGGTGLGLNISKSIVEAMGGHIGFRSEPGRGATFFVELPVVETQTAVDNGSSKPS